MVTPMPKLLCLLAMIACAGPARVEPTTPAPAPDPGAGATHEPGKMHDGKTHHGDQAHGGSHHGGSHHSGGMPHRFEKAEEWAKDFDDPARDAWQRPDLVLAALELAPRMQIADIGAGTGYFAVRLARAVPDGKIIATDIEPDMVRYMTERAARENLPNLRAALTPPDDPELPASALDRILIVNVWHHISDRPAYARRLARALHPGGKIAIVDFTLTSSHGPPPKHRLTSDQIIADLRSAGLTASLSPTALPEQYIVIGTR
jgi:SAM-dependent methyltransferase